MVLAQFGSASRHRWGDVALSRCPCVGRPAPDPTAYPLRGRPERQKEEEEDSQFEVWQGRESGRR